MEILMVLGVVASLIGAAFYNPVRRKLTGIVGVGGSYIILTGIMLLVMIIASLLSGGVKDWKASTMEIIITIIFMVCALGYMIYVMFTRCETLAQRLVLPFAACLVGLGFVWRLLFAIMLHLPMENGKSGSKFPAVLFDPNENEFRLQSDSTTHADYYCQKTGETVQFWDYQVDGSLPNGWRKGTGA